jgi:hypothetical protein
MPQMFQRLPITNCPSINPKKNGVERVRPLPLDLGVTRSPEPASYGVPGATL